MTGYVYVGFQNKRTKHGTFKIGETGRTPHIREGEIQRNECYKMVDWIKIPHTDKTVLEFVEAAMRFRLNQYKEFTHTGKDHFKYDITDRLTDIERIRKIAISIAIETCKQYGIEYEYNGKADWKIGFFFGRADFNTLIS